VNQQQFDKVKSAPGFIGALDQSGGSTPKALQLYGVEENEYSGEEEMFAMVHKMRSRIITSPAFSGDKILAAILFENTLDREIEGKTSAHYLWEVKNVAPILKIDKGLAEIANDVQIMKPNPGLDELLEKAVKAGVFGTKMRSVIHEANSEGVKQLVTQQFDTAKQIIATGLVPIVEPEVDIHSSTKAQAEQLLLSEIVHALDDLDDSQNIILKLTLPEETNFYQVLVNHPRVVRVVALSGGYAREVANAKLAQNNGVVASFSRALTEGLSAQQTDDEFNSTLASSIESIYQASIT